MTSRIALGAKYVSQIIVDPVRDSVEPVLTIHAGLAREFDDAEHAQRMADRINQAGLGTGRAIVQPVPVLRKRNVLNQPS